MLNRTLEAFALGALQDLVALQLAVVVGITRGCGA
jgi:hypothetical protein